MKIDEQGYKDGMTAFAKGKSLRSIVEAKIAIETYHGEDDGWFKKKDYQQSFEIGFAEAVLNKLRNMR